MQPVPSPSSLEGSLNKLKSRPDPPSLSHFVKDFQSLPPQISEADLHVASQALETYEKAGNLALENPSSALMGVSATSLLFGRVTEALDNLTKDLSTGEPELTRRTQGTISFLIQCLECSRSPFRGIPGPQLGALFLAMEASVLKELRTSLLEMARACFEGVLTCGGLFVELGKKRGFASELWVKGLPIQLESCWKAGVELLKDFISPFHDLEPGNDRIDFLEELCNLSNQLLGICHLASSDFSLMNLSWKHLVKIACRTRVWENADTYLNVPDIASSLLNCAQGGFVALFSVAVTNEQKGLFKKNMAILRFFLSHLHAFTKSFCLMVISSPSLMTEFRKVLLFMRARSPPSTLCLEVLPENLVQIQQHVVLGLDSVVSFFTTSKSIPEDQRIGFVRDLVDLSSPGNVSGVGETPLAEIRLAQLQYCCQFVNSLEEFSPAAIGQMFQPPPAVASAPKSLLGEDHESLATKISKLVDACSPGYLHLPSSLPTQGETPPAGQEDPSHFQDLLYSKLLSGLTWFLITGSLTDFAGVEAFLLFNVTAPSRHHQTALLFADVWLQFFRLNPAQGLLEQHFDFLTEVILSGRLRENHGHSRAVIQFLQARMHSLFPTNQPREYLDVIGLGGSVLGLDSISPEKLGLWKSLALGHYNTQLGSFLWSRMTERSLQCVNEILALDVLEGSHLHQAAAAVEVLVSCHERRRAADFALSVAPSSVPIVLVENLLSLFNPANFSSQQAEVYYYIGWGLDGAVRLAALALTQAVPPAAAFRLLSTMLRLAEGTPITFDDMMNPVPQPQANTPERQRKIVQALAPKLAVAQFLVSCGRITVPKNEEEKLLALLSSLYEVLLFDQDWVVVQSALESFMSFASDSPSHFVARILRSPLKEAFAQYATTTPVPFPGQRPGSLPGLLQEAEFFKGLGQTVCKNRAKLAAKTKSPTFQPQHQRTEIGGAPLAKKARLDLAQVETHFGALEEMLQGGIEDSQKKALRERLQRLLANLS